MTEREMNQLRLNNLCGKNLPTKLLSILKDKFQVLSDELIRFTTPTITTPTIPPTIPPITPPKKTIPIIPPKKTIPKKPIPKKKRTDIRQNKIDDIQGKINEKNEVIKLINKELIYLNSEKYTLLTKQFKGKKLKEIHDNNNLKLKDYNTASKIKAFISTKINKINNNIVVLQAQIDELKIIE